MQDFEYSLWRMLLHILIGAIGGTLFIASTHASPRPAVVEPLVIDSLELPAPPRP